MKEIDLVSHYKVHCQMFDHGNFSQVQLIGPNGSIIIYCHHIEMQVLVLCSSWIKLTRSTAAPNRNMWCAERLGTICTI